MTNSCPAFDSVKKDVEVDLDSLESCLKDVHKCLHMFFENKYDMERVHLYKYKDLSFVHAMELCYMTCCFSTLSMERVSNQLPAD